MREHSRRLGQNAAVLIHVDKGRRRPAPNVRFFATLDPAAKADQFRLEKMAYRYQRGSLIAPPAVENCWRRTRLRERPLIASSSAPTCRSTNAGMGLPQ
jgi:hypothetical protein